MAPPLREGPHRRAVGRPPVGTPADGRGRPGGVRRRADAPYDPARRHPPVDPPDGRGERPFADPRSDAFGTPSGCSRTVRSPSGSSAIPISRTRSATSWARTCRRRTGRWCFASTKRARIRALDRTQPMLPLRPGIPERRTRDYKRNGTTPASRIEHRFAEPAHKQLQRGTHASTRQPEADIRAFIETHNQNPKPFRWTKSADDILDAVKRFRLRVNHRSITNFDFR